MVFAVQQYKNGRIPRDEARRGYVLTIGGSPTTLLEHVSRFTFDGPIHSRT